MRVIWAFRDRLAVIGRSAAFAYATLALLQLKVVLGLWAHRDLTEGDTGSYFIDACGWFKTGVGPFTWSPLYALFYGGLFQITGDALFATAAHRLVILALVSLTVLAFMRRLFPPPLAWLVSAWWALLPVNFDATYEVHLFGLLPLLLGLLVMDGEGRWRRGLGVSLLLLGALIVRNELILVAAPVAFFVVLSEYRASSRGAVPWRPLFRSYGVPLVACLLIALLFYSRASDRGAILSAVHTRHTLGLCQVFSYAHEEQYHDAQGRVWTECHHLMEQVFGRPYPSLIQALRANPRAVFGFFAWNLRMLPAAVQVLLFNAISGGVSPDFAEVPRSPWVSTWSLLLLGVAVAAAVRCLRDPQEWLAWFRSRAWAWLGIACIVGMSAVVSLTLRPRPDYLFPLEIVLHTLVGAAFWVLVKGWTPWPLLEYVYPVAAVAMALAWPSYEGWSPPDRTLALAYERLKPNRALFQVPGTRLVARPYVGELCSYLSASRDACTPFYFDNVKREVDADAPLAELLRLERASLFYVDETMMSDPRVRKVVSSPPPGWRVVAFEAVQARAWALLHKEDDPPLVRPRLDIPAVDITPQGDEVVVGSGWYDLESYGGLTFRWAPGDATIEFQDLGERWLELSVEPGPGNVRLPLVLTAFVDDLPQGRDLQLLGRDIIVLDSLPPRGQHRVRLHPHGEGRPLATDPRLLRFRAFKIRMAECHPVEGRRDSTGGCEPRR